MVANYKQEFVYKEIVVAYHKVISKDLSGGTQESQGVSQSGWLDFRQR
jgi:hypothetical protein